MIESYILVNAEARKAGQVVEAIRALRWVVHAEPVTGAYDVIAKATAASLDELANLVIEEIQPIHGVIRTLTCPAASHAHLWEERLEPAYAG